MDQEKDSLTLLDPKNITLVDFKFRALSCYVNGMAWAPVEAKEK